MLEIKIEQNNILRLETKYHIVLFLREGISNSYRSLTTFGILLSSEIITTTVKELTSLFHDQK